MRAAILHTPKLAAPVSRPRRLSIRASTMWYLSPGKLRSELACRGLGWGFADGQRRRRCCVSIATRRRLLEASAAFSADPKWCKQNEKLCKLLGQVELTGPIGRCGSRQPWHPWTCSLPHHSCELALSHAASACAPSPPTTTSPRRRRTCASLSTAASTWCLTQRAPATRWTPPPSSTSRCDGACGAADPAADQAAELATSSSRLGMFPA